MPILNSSSHKVLKPLPTLIYDVSHAPSVARPWVPTTHHSGRAHGAPRRSAFTSPIALRGCWRGCNVKAGGGPTAGPSQRWLRVENTRCSARARGVCESPRRQWPEVSGGGNTPWSPPGSSPGASQRGRFPLAPSSSSPARCTLTTLLIAPSSSSPARCSLTTIL